MNHITAEASLDTEIFSKPVDNLSDFCYIEFSDRTGETCEASGPEGSCGGLSLFQTQKRGKGLGKNI